LEGELAAARGNRPRRLERIPPQSGALNLRLAVRILSQLHYKTVAFLHLPKTGGITLIKYLQEYLLRLPLIHLQCTCDFLDGPQNSEGSRLVAGHYFYPLLEILGRPLYSITFLRDPVQRAISAYQYILRNPGHPLHPQLSRARIGAPSQFVTDNLFSFHGANMMTRMLGADYDLRSVVDRIHKRTISAEEGKAIIDWMEKRPCDAGVLNRAMIRLERMSFLGLTEHWRASLELLCRSIEAPVPAELFRENAAPEPDLAARNALSKDEVEAVREANRFDEILYRFGQRLFYERCERQAVAAA